MKSKIQTWTRRRVLRGMLAGSAVTIGLPILDCTLNDNGTAFADTGAPLPTRFAAWFALLIHSFVDFNMHIPANARLLFALTGFHRLLVTVARRKFSIGRAELLWAGAFLAIVVPHFLWRRWYYGWWLPNTFYIKSSGVGGAWAQGGYYLLRVVEQFHLWIVPLVAVAASLYDILTFPQAPYLFLFLSAMCITAASEERVAGIPARLVPQRARVRGHHRPGERRPVANVS